MNHQISYDLALARCFGDAYDNYAWFNNQMSQTFATLSFMILGNWAVDSLAIIATFKCLENVFAGRLIGALILAGCLGSLFFISLANYDALFMGNEGSAGEFLLMIGLMAFPIGVCLLLGVIESKTLGEWALSSLLIFGLVLLFALLHATAVSDGHPLRYLADFLLWPIGFLLEWIQDVRLGSNAKAVLMAMETVFPLICAASIALIIYVGKPIILAVKEVFLWSVLGNSTIAGLGDHLKTGHLLSVQNRPLCVGQT